MIFNIKKNYKQIDLIIIKIISFLIISFVFLFITSPVYAIETWRDSNYNYRREITVENDNIDATLSNFTLLIKLADSSAVNKDNIADGRYTFYDSLGNELDFENEVYSEGISYVNMETWVEIGTLNTDSSTTTDDSIWIYYGYDEGDQDDGSGAWNNDYKGVWHLNEDVTDGGSSSNVHTDSTVNANHGDQSGNVEEVGKISDGQNFNNTNDYIETGASITSIVDDWTMMAWINPDSLLADGEWRNIFYNGDDYAGYGIGIRGVSGDTFVTGLYGRKGWHITDKQISTTSQWYHIAMRRSGGTLKIFLNGQIADYSSTITPYTPHSTHATIGNMFGQDHNTIYDNSFDGQIDEVRMSSTNLSSEWIKFAYANMGGEVDNEIVIGSEEDNISPSVSTLNPVDNATSVAIDTNLVMTFDEAVDVESGNIIIYKTSDNSTIETIAVDDTTGTGTTEITINPTSNLDYETEYYIFVDATAFDDSLSNSYAGISVSTTWSFTTSDTPACPSISNASTYNTYPTCGVETCDSDYTLTAGACVYNNVGSAFIPPSLPKVITPPSFINNTINFTVNNVYQIAISESKDFDGVSWEAYSESYKISKKTLYIKFRSKDGGVSKVYVVNPFEKEGFCAINSYEDKLIKYANSPKIYLIENCKKRWVVDEKTYEYHNYSWKEFIIIEDSIIFEDDEDINVDQNIKNINYLFTKNLRFGMVNKTVKKLQKYLNRNGFVLNDSGPGSIGNETNVFGSATLSALIRFQRSVNLPAYGYFGLMTRRVIN